MRLHLHHAQTISPRVYVPIAGRTFWTSTWSYASAIDRGLALTSKALVLSCDDLLWYGILAMILFLKFR